MNINYRKIKSFGYKLFVSVLCAFILVFSYEVNKPKAIAPLIVWGGSLLAGVLVEEAVEMGIRSFTAEGKATKKAKTVKLGKEISKEIAEYGFDLMKDKPTKKADGSLVIKPSANDRAKLAKKIADEFDDIIDVDLSQQTKWKSPKFYVDANDTDPLFQTSVGMSVIPYSNLAHDLKAHDMFIRLANFKFTPMAYQKKTNFEVFSAITGSLSGSKELYGGREYLVSVRDNGFADGRVRVFYQELPNGGLSSFEVNLGTYVAKMYQQYIYSVEQANSQIFFGLGLSVPKTIKNVYPAPKHLPSDFELPNKEQLSNKPIIIENMFPPSDKDVEISWEDIDRNYYQGNETEWEQKLEQYIDNRIEYGDIINSNNNNYTYNIINNYYTDINYDVKADEVEEKLPAPPKVDDGDLPVEGGTADPLDRSMLSYIRESYEYLGDSIDNNLKVMKDVVDDAGGVVDFLDESFDWLPAEWRAYFGAAFILGVVAHFFRR